MKTSTQSLVHLLFDPLTTSIDEKTFLQDLVWTLKTFFLWISYRFARRFSSVLHAEWCLFSTTLYHNKVNKMTIIFDSILLPLFLEFVQKMLRVLSWVKKSTKDRLCFVLFYLSVRVLTLFIIMYVLSIIMKMLLLCLTKRVIIMRMSIRLYSIHTLC